MLKELYIHNIALIKSLRIEFERGLNVLTGETGAGKSIVVDCVNMALGQRAGRELIRNGEQKGSVKALFDISETSAAKEFLNTMQLDYEDDYVEITREISAGGRNICRINGTMVTLAVLKSFTSILVDLHGQQEHQRLMDPTWHANYLDGFGGSELLSSKARVKQAYEAYSKARSDLKKLNLDEATRAQKIDILRMQLSEINSAKLKEDEEVELERKSVLYENAEKLSNCTRAAYERVYLGGKSISAQESLKRAIDSISQLTAIDDSYTDIESRLEELMIQVRDIGYDLQARLEEMNFDPLEADKVYERLELIKKLKRKYGNDVASIIKYGKKAEEELKSLESIDEKRDYYTQAVVDTKKVLLEEASKLTSLRRQAAKELEREIISQLSDLGMGRTKLETSFKTLETVCADGAEEIEFLISPNPGEPLRPLTQIASGGEISRFMLALKVILAENDGIETMIFDEIDTGISGKMAQTVGEKMALLGNKHQVICVTHLAQIASLGDAQFVVEKQVVDDQTSSSVMKLDDGGRVNEISRLVGGAETDLSGIEHARSMLLAAEQKKKLLRG